MKTSKMISELTKIMDAFGDVDVFVNGKDDDVHVTEVWYDDESVDSKWHGAYIATEEWANGPFYAEEDW